MKKKHIQLACNEKKAVVQLKKAAGILLFVCLLFQRLLLKQTNESIFHSLILSNEQWAQCISLSLSLFSSLTLYLLKHLISLWWRIGSFELGARHSLFCVLHFHIRQKSTNYTHVNRHNYSIKITIICGIDDEHFLWNDADSNNYRDVRWFST